MNWRYVCPICGYLVKAPSHSFVQHRCPRNHDEFTTMTATSWRTE